MNVAYGTRGLSLIELMVALVLGLLVVGAAFAIFQSNQLTYRSNEGLNRMQESARIAFELMSADVRAAGGNSCSKYSLVAGSDSRQEAVRFRDTPVSGSSTRLRLVGGDNVAYRVVSATSSSITLDPADITTPQVFDDGDVLVLCNPSKTFVVEVTNVSGTTVNFSPSLPAGVSINATPVGPTTAVLARMRDIEWYVDVNPRGGTSLFMSRGGGGRPRSS
ncbi:type IV pilus assembly protein PilW [Pseudoxanthomonas japonensis]|uniref:PilW family protein n=1 Tax=Pseudoxanthomonas japonensis TaxID=69284 RepID=UPI0028626558|nr:prepilin-type N-terminal cleavage/methylation domain-containing protein [Pseudoxanthomonas japonensis]MDR7067683.1 type IV pilus assembly protein PilW [Pseudoxanthomonas japonensis]